MPDLVTRGFLAQPQGHFKTHTYTTTKSDTFQYRHLHFCARVRMHNSLVSWLCTTLACLKHTVNHHQPRELILIRTQPSHQTKCQFTCACVCVRERKRESKVQIPQVLLPKWTLNGLNKREKKLCQVRGRKKQSSKKKTVFRILSLVLSSKAMPNKSSERKLLQLGKN